MSEEKVDHAAAPPERPDVGPVDVVKSKCQQPCCADPKFAPMMLVLRCPSCKMKHVDQGEWATKKHHKHKCVDYVLEEIVENTDPPQKRPRTFKGCGFVWQPSLIATVGVKDL